MENTSSDAGQGCVGRLESKDNKRMEIQIWYFEQRIARQRQNQKLKIYFSVPLVQKTTEVVHKRTQSLLVHYLFLLLRKKQDLVSGNCYYCYSVGSLVACGK